jgi:hypothetical protein
MSTDYLRSAEQALAGSKLLTAAIAVGAGMALGLPEPGMLAAINQIGAQAVLASSVADAVMGPIESQYTRLAPTSMQLGQSEMMQYAFHAAVAFGVGYMLAGLDGFGPRDLQYAAVVAIAKLGGDFASQQLGKMASGKVAMKAAGK